MKKILLTSAAMAVLGVSVAMNVLAQPPAGEGRPDGPPPGGDRGPDGPPRPPHPVMDALDKDGNREISEDELNNAVAALKGLDKNSDGKLSDDEIRPPRPEGGPDQERGPDRDGRPDDGGRGPDGPPRGDGPPRSEGPPRGDQRPGFDRPPGDQRGRDGQGPPPRDGEGRPPGDGERRPPGGRDQGRGDMGPGRPPGPPNPERFVDDALRFDADADGKLSKEELMKFAVEMGNRQGRPPGPDGGRGPGRPEGDRREGGRPEGGPPEGERPQRPPVEE